MENDGNPLLEEFKLIDKYQGQHYRVDSDQGEADTWEDRRFRLGFDAKMFARTIELRVNFQSADDFDPFYNGLEGASIKWKPRKDFTFAVGRLRAKSDVAGGAFRMSIEPIPLRFLSRAVSVSSSKLGPP